MTVLENILITILFTIFTVAFVMINDINIDAKFILFLIEYTIFDYHILCSTH